MGKLDHLLQMVQAEKNVTINPSDITGLFGIASLFSGMEKNVEALVIALGEVNERIGTAESNVTQAVDNIAMPDSGPEVSQARSDIAELRGEVADIISSVKAIKMPKQKDFPAIPEPMEIDYARIERCVADGIEALSIPTPETPKREAEFEIVRNNFGAIDKVIVKEI